MTSMYDEVGISGDVTVAATIEEQHRDGQTCHQCGEDGCEAQEWSRRLLTAHRRDRVQYA
jgi:hypothetical protein